MRWQAARIFGVILLSATSLFAQAQQGASTPGAPAAGAAGRPNPASNPDQPKPWTGIIRGRITSAETGRPIRGATVIMFNTQGSPIPRVNRTTTTNRDGQFEFAALPAQKYAMSASKSGYAWLGAEFRPNSLANVALDLNDGQTLEHVDFRLFRGSVIAGRITDEFGEPLAGASVSALRQTYISGGRRELVKSGSLAYQYSTNDRGEFRIFGLSPGTYLVTADSSPATTFVPTPNGVVSGQSATTSGGTVGLGVTYYPGTLSPGDAQPVRVGVAEEVPVSFALVPAKLARISGVVRTSQGRPGANFRVSLTAERGTGLNAFKLDQTKPDGSFSFGAIPPGEYRVEVETSRQAGQCVEGCAGLERASVPVAIDGTDVANLMVTTSPGIPISGHVTYVGKAPPVDNQYEIIAAAVEYSNTPGMSYNDQNHGRVDEAGNFRIPGASGQVLLRDSGLQRPWITKAVMLNGRDIIDIPLDLDSTTAKEITGVEIVIADHRPSVVGSARLSNGELVQERYKVALFPTNLPEGAVPHRRMYTSFSDANGHYSFGQLPAGDYIGVATRPFEAWFEWDPDFQKKVKPLGKQFKVGDDDKLTIDLPFVE